MKIYKSLIKKIIIAQAVVFVFLGLQVVTGCDKNDQETSFSADFSYQYTDANHVRFENKSQGEYYYLIWDFGNDQTDTTNDKKKSYNVYYPQAGNYDVTLKLTNYTGDSKSVTKTVNIETSDLTLSFTMEILPSAPNFVNLKNTTQGSFDSFKWIYRNKTVENQVEHSAYFPYAGYYEITLQVTKDNISSTLKKSVNINQDDPDYIQNLTLVWSDEFDGTSVNQDFWTFETGASGWGNNELQNYTNGANAEVTDGKLIITARKVNENTQVGSYTSSRLITKGKKDFCYGRMEIRAKLPSGRGIWPAIWMLGSNFNTAGWPACGEIDIMEYVGYQPNIIHSTVHTSAGYGSAGSGNSMTVTTCEEEYHNYGLIWTEKKLTFYVDTPDNVVHTYAPAVQNEQTWPFSQPAFFILNVAVGGNWGGAQGIDNSIFPQSMGIDYVRVYQEPVR